MKRRNKILIAAAFVLVLGFLLLKPSGNHRRALEEYKKELRAKGEKLTIAELIPPRILDESNGAALFMKAMNAYTTPSDYPSSMKMIAPGVAIAGHTLVEPVHMTNYASNVLKMAEVRMALQASALDFGLDYSQGIDASLIHVMKPKAAAILVSITLTQALHRRDFPEAWSELLAGVDLIRLWDNEPLMISDMVRIAMGHIIMAATWEGLQTGQWTEPQLTELQLKWERLEFFKKVEASMGMERAWGIDAYTKFRTNRQAFLAAQDPFLGPFGSPVSGDGFLDDPMAKIKELYNRYPRYWRWKSSWSYDEELFQTQISTAARNASRRMRESGAFVPIMNELNLEFDDILKMHAGGTNHYLLSLLGRFDEVTVQYLKRTAIVETTRHMLAAAIALERYRLQHKAYPVALGDLVPKYLTTVPLDFMDGKPLRYQIKADGSFLLYSVGENGKDDGGDGAPGILSGWAYSRDAVWPRAATPAEVEQYHQSQKKSTNGPGNNVQIRE